MVSQLRGYPQANWLQRLAATTWKISCVEADLMEQNLLQWGSHSLSVSLLRWLGGASMWSKAVHQVLWLWGLPGGIGQGQLPCVPCSSYKVICRWLLLVLGLEVPRRGQAANHSQLLLVLGLGSFSKRYIVFQGQMLLVWEIFRRSKARAKAGHFYGKATGNRLGGPAVEWGWILGNHQGRANCVSRVMETQI